MKTTSRAFKYLAACIGEGGLPVSEGALLRTWGMLSKPRKRYASYLVKRYGYPVRFAIQQSYIHGFDSWPYDYREHHMVRETAEPKQFGFRK